MDELPFFGRYEAVERLGSGSFATVWRCRDPDLGGDVAVKVLEARHAADEAISERFVREGQLLRRTDGQGRIVAVHDVGRAPDGRPFLVMEYATRGTVADRLSESPASPDAVRQLVDALEPCLSVLEANEIVHRDLKPSNLLITTHRGSATPGPLLQPDERLVLGDLGLAKPVDSNWDGTVIGGTPAYMPPEQQLPGAIDERADLYAATAVVLRAASGRTPPPSLDGADHRLDLPAEFPMAFVDAIRRGMAPNPDDRPATVAAWAASLRAGLGAQRARSRRVVLAAGALVVLAIAAFLAPWPREEPALAVSGPVEVGGDVVVEGAGGIVIDHWSVSPPAFSDAADTVDTASLLVRPIYPRPITVTGTTATGEEHVVVLDPVGVASAPRIDGPTVVRAGESAAFTVDVEDCAGIEWAIETGSGVQKPGTGCGYEFTTRQPGIVFVLASVDLDGRRIGSAFEVRIDAA